MYLQVILLPEDRPLHSFLWRDLNPHQEPEVYEFSRLIFGGCYGPFCAQYVWQRHAEMHGQEYQLASKAVKDNCYMNSVTKQDSTFASMDVFSGLGRRTTKSSKSFSDASDRFYAAAIYARHEYDDETVSVQLVAAKSRLAPVKAVSIPRLELMGALAGQRLTKKVCSALALPLDKVTYWVDSDNVEFWIEGQSRNYKPFVAYKVGEIHEESNPDQWRYVPTKLNSADKATRGLSADELSTDENWWNGPSFLQKNQSEWPTRKFGSAPDAQREVKSDKRVKFAANGNETDQQEHLTYLAAEPQEF